ncbi:hypothetical protein SAMN05216275_12410 [Streptosporangium canum]|uniref:Uncharacterized protein n=1 Tax=Streptosporangium canum TaxID=324952 RepID=A0A1I3Z5I3_9ACTN|nr:hypothetical protein SAMN05216275_12410 [Streptosporangium canum]
MDRNRKKADRRHHDRRKRGREKRNREKQSRAKQSRGKAFQDAVRGGVHGRLDRVVRIPLRDPGQTGPRCGWPVRIVHGDVHLEALPRDESGDSSRPNRAALRTVATLLLGDSPSGPVYPGFHAPAHDPVPSDAGSALPAVSNGQSRELGYRSRVRPRPTVPAHGALPQPVPVKARSGAGAPSRTGRTPMAEARGPRPASPIERRRLRRWPRDRRSRRLRHRRRRPCADGGGEQSPGTPPCGRSLQMKPPLYALRATCRRMERNKIDSAR